VSGTNYTFPFLNHILLQKEAMWLERNAKRLFLLKRTSSLFMGSAGEKSLCEESFLLVILEFVRKHFCEREALP